MTSPRPLLAYAAPPAGFLALCAAELWAIRASTAGSFTYTLDDPYIHLALAENIVRGTYGVNLAEVSAPSSSVLWPLLLAPFARASAGDLAPLCINLAAGTATVALTQRFLRDVFTPRAPASHWLIALATLLLAVVTNSVGLVFTGMEHSLQVLGAVAMLHATYLEQRDGRLRWWFASSALVLPLIRYESLVLTGPLLLHIALRGRLRQAVVLGLSSAAPLVAFSCFLLAHDLGVLPTSVQAKSGVLYTSLLDRLSGMVGRSWGDPHAALFFLLTFGFMLLALLSRLRVQRSLALALALATLGHSFVGKFGWFDRYEVYLLNADILGLTWLLRDPVRSLAPRMQLRVTATLALALLMALGSYIATTVRTPGAARNVYEQQLQMHRFATEYYRKPVAVEDLGLVSYRNDAYVLDLGGLASQEALYANRHEAPGIWKERLVRERGIGLAMIYDPGPGGVPASWVKLGSLHLAGTRVSVAEDEVLFFATDSRDETNLRHALARFVPTLPKGVVFAAADAADACVVSVPPEGADGD